MNDARRKLLALAHMAAARLGLDEDERRDVQREVGGAASCRDMSDASLRKLLWHYKRLGADIFVPGPATAELKNRPTAAQMREIERLSFAMGWDGLEDARLSGFVKRTARVEAARFLTRRGATRVILGLSAWLRGRK